MIAHGRAHEAWQRLMPVAQPREEKPASERTNVVPRRICGQSVAPEADAVGGIDLADATADGPKMTLILRLEGSALREPFGHATHELHLFHDVLRLQLTLAQPGKLISGIGRQERRNAQRPGTQVRVAEMVHACMIAPTPATMFQGPEDGNGPHSAED